MYNYCIIPEKNVACNSEEKNGECKFEEKKTASVNLKKKNDECNGKKKTASVYSHGPSRPSYICLYCKGTRHLLFMTLIYHI